MRIGDDQLIKSCDTYCIETLGIPSIVLMENAALKVVKNLNLEKNNSFVIVSGRGNNGGDALAVARHLYAQGKHIEVYIIGLNTMTKDCEKNYNILMKMGLKVTSISNVEDIEDLRNAINRCDVIIDGIFGIGLNRAIKGIYDMAITVINENSKETIAIDVPSGMNGKTGKVMGNCVRANKTITFEVLKEGLINYDTDKYCGNIIIEKIGIPESVVAKFHKGIYMLTEKTIKSKLHPRGKYGYKGEYGYAAIVAGSEEYVGAPIITANAAVRSGAGLVTLCTRNNILGNIKGRLLEAMPCAIEDERFDDILADSTAIAIGPGMGNNEETLEILKRIVYKYDKPLVIDADGLNVLEDNIELLKKYKGKIILTPHLGEMSRLSGLSVKEIREKRLEISLKFAKENNVILLLKGYNTIITDGETAYINPTGNSSMANGGMGDCLTGIIVAFLAQGYSAIEAAYISAYIHGKCGDELSKDMFCVNASHIIEKIPFVIKEFIRI